MARPDDDRPDAPDATPPDPAPMAYSGPVDGPLLEAYRTMREAIDILLWTELRDPEDMRRLRRRLDSDPRQQDATQQLLAAWEEFKTSRPGGDQEPVTPGEWIPSPLRALVTGRQPDPSGGSSMAYSPDIFPAPFRMIAAAVAARTRSDFLLRLEEAHWNFLDAWRAYPHPAGGTSSGPPVLVVNDADELAAALRERPTAEPLAPDAAAADPRKVLTDLAEARSQLQFVMTRPMDTLRVWLHDGGLAAASAAAEQDPWGLDQTVEERLRDAGFPPSLSAEQQRSRAHRVARRDRGPVEAGLRQLAQLQARLQEVTGAGSLAAAIAEGHEHRGGRQPEYLRVVSGDLDGGG